MCLHGFMPPLAKVGVIGAGYFGQFHINAWQRLPVDLVGVYDPAKPDCLSTLEALLTHEPDVIDITAPPDQHLKLIKALEGKTGAIVCQKPFCGGLAGAIEAVGHVKKTRLLVHENIRFQPWYTAIHTAIADGKIGTPYHATFRFRPGDGQGPKAYLARQPYFQTMPRFLVHESAVHWIDTFRYLFGTIGSVTATLNRRNPAIVGEDSALVQFGFENGMTALFDGNRLADHPAKNPRLTLGEMVIDGSDGTLSLNGDGEVSLRAHGEQDSSPIAFDWQDRDFGGDCVKLTSEHLLDAILTGAASPLDAASYLENLRIVEAVYESDASSCRINSANFPPVDN